MPEVKAPPTPEPKSKTVSVTALKAVYGLTIHPYTQARFDTNHSTDHVIDEWVKVQMDAGKIVNA